MNNHVPTLVSLGALFILVLAVIILTLLGVKPEGIAMMGIASAIGAIVAGITPSFARSPSQVTNLPNAKEAVVSNAQSNDAAAPAEPAK